MERHYELFKIVAYMVKIVKFVVRKISEHP